MVLNHHLTPVPRRRAHDQALLIRLHLPTLLPTEAFHNLVLPSLHLTLVPVQIDPLNNPTLLIRLHPQAPLPTAVSLNQEHEVHPLKVQDQRRPQRTLPLFRGPIPRSRKALVPIPPVTHRLPTAHILLRLKVPVPSRQGTHHRLFGLPATPVLLTRPRLLKLQVRNRLLIRLLLIPLPHPNLQVQSFLGTRVASIRLLHLHHQVRSHLATPQLFTRLRVHILLPRRIPLRNLKLLDPSRLAFHQALQVADILPRHPSLPVPNHLVTLRHIVVLTPLCLDLLLP